MKSFGDRVRECRLNAGLSLEALGKVAGIKKAAMSNIENGKSQYVRSDNLFPIAKALKVNAEWLVTGKGKREPNSSSDLVPLISWVQAGEWTEAFDPYAVGDGVDFIICPFKHGDLTFALKVRGESMSPYYVNGETIFVDPDVRAENGSKVVTRNMTDNTATFKQLIVDESGPMLKAMNKDWPNKFIEITDELRICGVVIGSTKESNYES
jgi:SOS-response transcriptional repressor LexA